MSILRKIGLGLGLFTILALFFLVVLTFYEFKYAPLVKQTPVKPLTIKILPWMSSDSLITELHKLGLIRYPSYWQMFSFIRVQGEHFKVGEYEIKPGMSFSQLLRNILQGKGFYMRKITIIEGWTYKDFIRLLEKNPNIVHTLTPALVPNVMSLIGSTETKPEGMFFPDTYFYTWGNTDLSVLKRSYNKMQRVLTRAWENRAGDLPYQNSYAALIVASLIEKETALASERPIVASVIINRLRMNMPLQVDPTVSYGLGDAKMKLTRRHLKMYTVYNTYLLRGLPPTPISLPSKSAILAALHPAQTRFLYYVARGDGGHYFTETYAEHLRAVNLYRKDMTIIEDQSFSLEGILQLRGMRVNKQYCERIWNQNVAVSSR